LNAIIDTFYSMHKRLYVPNLPTLDHSYDRIHLYISPKGSSRQGGRRGGRRRVFYDFFDYYCVYEYDFFTALYKSQKKIELLFPKVQRLPNLQNMQSALDSIMELVEEKLNEGDYLTVSNHLKSIYDGMKAKPQRVVDEHIVWTDDRTVTRPNVAFRLTTEERRLVMHSRMHEYYQREIDDLLFDIEDTQEKLARVVAAKKMLWTMSRNKIARDDYKIEHKEMCAVEKEMKLTLREFKKVKISSGGYIYNQKQLRQQLLARLTHLILHRFLHHHRHIHN
jgi:hypothetical protein